MTASLIVICDGVYFEQVVLVQVVFEVILDPHPLVERIPSVLGLHHFFFGVRVDAHSRAW